MHCKRCKLKMRSRKKINHGGIIYVCPECNFLIFKKIKGIGRNYRQVDIPITPDNPLITDEGTFTYKELLENG